MSLPKLFSIILATDSENGIGYIDIESNTYSIPWNHKKDMEYFKNITSYSEHPSKQNACIMGYNTWTTLKNTPFANRKKIIITSKIIPNETTFTNLNDALDHLSNCDYINNIFIIGGSRLYEEAINHPRLHYVYWTKIDRNYNCSIKVNMNINNCKLIKQNNIYDNNVELSFYKYKHVHEEYQYLNIMNKIIQQGTLKVGRNGNTKSIFGEQMIFNVSNGVLPVLTTKRIFIIGVFEELMFFLRGETNTNKLEDKGVKIWKGNTNRAFLDSVGLNHYEEGDLGTAYSFQFRHYGAEYNGMNDNYVGQGFDQLQYVVNELIMNRMSRRIIMTTYNPAQVKLGPLPPCHGIVIQFGIENDKHVCCHMYQRSSDFFLGEPWNITSYALMLFIVTELVNNSDQYSGPTLYPSKLIISLGDVHLYEEHIKHAETQIKRDPFDFPTISFNKKITSVDNLCWEDLKISNYKYHPNNFGAQMVA